MKNSRIANINIKLKDLFYKWIEFTHPFHKLPGQQQKILALFLYYHFIYKQQITNDKILWKTVFDYDTKMLIKQELGIKDPGFQNVMSSLRKKGIIKDKQIQSFYIPNLEKDSNNFKIIFNFNIIDAKR